MAFLKCEECKYEEQCPVFWSYLNAACITIQKEKENKMKDNSVYEVERDDYVGFLAQLNKEKMDVEQHFESTMVIMKIVSKATGTHLCTRIIPEDGDEHYFIFNMPADDERVPPKPVRKITLDTKEEVQAFFDTLKELQRREKE